MGLMRVSEPYRWVEASKVRHAVDAGLEFGDGDEIATLCGVTAVVGAWDRRREMPYPECQDCDRTWRERTGMPTLGSEVDTRGQLSGNG